MFLERPGEVVTREAVRERLWPADTFVDFDHSLNTAIKKLRQALGDSAENPRFIETLARRGYRFIAPVGRRRPCRGPGGRWRPRRSMAETPAGAVLHRSSAAAAVQGRAARSWRSRCVEPADAPRGRLGRRGGYAVAPPAPAGSRSAGTVQLAVLPLKVLTPGDTEKYLGVGIADAVITQLANVRTLSVRPTAAVINYEAGAADPRLAGQELDAEHVLSGTLQKSDETYRVSMQLIRTADGVPIWGRSYHVARTDLLTIEEQVSQQVADALRVAAAGPPDGARHADGAKDPAAYESYLQGRALLVNYSEAKMRAAIESFERAVQLEPEYALARAGLATSLAWFSVRYAYQKDATRLGTPRRRRSVTGHWRSIPTWRKRTSRSPAAAGTIYGHFNWPRLLAEVDEALKLDPTARSRATRHGRAACITSGCSTPRARPRPRRSRSIPQANVETDRLLGRACRCSAAASKTPGNAQKNWPAAPMPR